MLLNNVLNVLCSVSVRTSVPAMNVTPITMANAVSASRSLCASRPLMVTRHISGSQGADALQHRIGGRLCQLVDDVAVRQEDDTVRIGRPVGIVRHHDDGLPEFGDRSAHEGEHLLCGVGVEVPGGLAGN